LSERQRGRLDEHLKQCPSCRREAFYFSEIAALSNKLEPVAVRPDFNLRLRAAIQRQENSAKARHHWYQLNLPPVWRTAMAGAAVLALFAVTYGGYRIFNDGNGQTQTVAPVIAIDQNWSSSAVLSEVPGDVASPEVPSGWTPVNGLSPDAQRLRERYLAACQGPSEYILETVRLDDLNMQEAEPRYVMPVVRSDQVTQKDSY
jgi:anti-sigma factor RsiW